MRVAFYYMSWDHAMRMARKLKKYKDLSIVLEELDMTRKYLWEKTHSLHFASYKRLTPLFKVEVFRDKNEN